MLLKDYTKYTGRALKCEVCGETSQHVHASTKYNKKLCIECLTDTVVADIKSQPY